MIDELFENLPFDSEGPSPAFKPYTHKAEKAVEWAKQNTLPICGIILAVVMI